MKDICKLKDTHENYTRLIREISEQNEALRRMALAAETSFEKMSYEEAIFQNELAINRICVGRLKLTMDVLGE